MCIYLNYKYPCGHKHTVIVNRCEYGSAGLVDHCVPEIISHKYEFNCGQCTPTTHSSLSANKPRPPVINTAVANSITTNPASAGSSPITPRSSTASSMAPPTPPPSSPIIFSTHYRPRR
ncbi:uncharacterized protein SAPINGB_P005882 [Magnusiomyces paraingens]|uniref:Uncharacterized protein n=1 Tax=Magnusiomyces paraingens TaxID=2606893 RepID=A0A5E8C2I3_9ASCO|nr:uncharacterized protein SAPINGB_P005882 [Saprochaete ingens]VVT57813.1 unnamed protein product [Saprochaete ingens]